MTAEDKIFSLEGKTVLITGGSRGIGYAIAEGIIDAGGRVIISARNSKILENAAQKLGPNALAITCDVGDPKAINTLIETAWGLGPVDVLVNNAGISPFYNRAEHVTVEEFNSITDVNLRGAYFCSVELARYLFDSKRSASIINIASVLGLQPDLRQSVYAMSKAGLIQITKALALEWADRDVRVNCLAPGWITSDMTDSLLESRHGERLLSNIPMGRYGSVGDVVGAALYLASESSTYVTGAVITVDGGRALR